jgi:hypothetical protein
MIHYSCPQCGEDLESPDCLIGQSETCPGCQTAVEVPPGDVPAEALDAVELPAPPPVETSTEDLTPPPAEPPVEPQTQPEDLPLEDEPAINLTPETQDQTPAPPPAPFAPQEPVADEPAETADEEIDFGDDDDISLGIFDDAPNAEAEIRAEEEAKKQQAQADAQQDEPAMTETQDESDDDAPAMPPPSPPQSDPSWGILDHAKAAANEVSEEDKADVAAYATGPQQPEADDDEVSEEDTVRQIDVAAMAERAQQQHPMAAGAPQMPAAGVFIPGIGAADDPPGTPAPPQQGKPQAAESQDNTETAGQRTKAPMPLLLLGGLMALVGVLVAALVVVLGLIRGNVLPAENYTFLEGLLAYRPMILLGVNAALLLLTGAGFILMRRYAKIIGGFWSLQVFIVLAVEIYLRLNAGTARLEDILQPAPLGLVAGSAFLALLTAIVLFAYGNRFVQTGKQTGKVKVLSKDTQPPQQQPPQQSPPGPPSLPGQG